MTTSMELLEDGRILQFSNKQGGVLSFRKVIFQGIAPASGLWTISKPTEAGLNPLLHLNVEQIDTLTAFLNKIRAELTET